jgi:hypothetical protein
VINQSALEFAPDGRYEIVLALGIATHLEDAEVDALAALCARALAPGGLCVLKEPVTTTGTAREDVRRDSSGRVVYRARFRPREAYAETFARHLLPIYQRATCAHLFPWFLGGTDGAVAAAASPLGRVLFARAARLLERADPALQTLEQRLRAHPQLQRLLARVEVVQDFYLFAPRPAGTPALSVVAIAYNEAESVTPVVRELLEALARAGIGFEVVLVDDGSTDDTAARMRELAAADPRVRVVSYRQNRGIGGALRAGFDAAAGDFVTWIPADGQIPPDAVLELYRRRGEGAMLTTVYRRRADPWYRHVISQTLNLLIRVHAGQPAKSGGNYLFARSAWAAHAPRGDDSMMLSTAFRQRLRDAGEPIVEVAIDCRPRHAGSSKVLNPRTILRTLGGLFALRRQGPR